MAFTKVLGPGIHTQANILSHNINSSGIITATKFVGPFDGTTIGSGTTIGADGINVTGIVTCTTLDVNGNGDISGNLVIGGNLTANGDLTTLNTTLREVELLRVDANSSVAAGIITQTGAGDILNLFDGTTEVFTVLDTGEVGIGTVTPGRDLHILNTTPYIRIESDAANQPATLELYHTRGNGSDHWPTSVTTDDAALTFNVATAANGSPAEKVRITSAGRVGINETSPDTDLHIKNTNPAIILEGTNGSGKQHKIWSAGTNSETLQITSGNYYNNADIHYFRASNESTVQARIDNTGIGIGGVTPVRELHVHSGDSGSTYIALTNSTTGTTTSDGFGIGLGGDEDAKLWNYENTNMMFATNSTERLRITSTGLVGIGTEVPVGNLEVRDTKANLIVAKDGLTVKGNSNIASNYDFFQIGAGGALASYNVETVTASTHLIHNAYRSSAAGTPWKRRYQDTSMRLRMNSPGRAFIFESAASGSADADITFAEQLRITSDSNLKLPDNAKIELGGAQTGAGDFQIYHDTVHTYLKNKHASGYTLLQVNDNEYGIKIQPSGFCQLYHANALKLSTSTTGISVTGEVASSQDFPNYRPRLDLNFVAVKKLDSRLTYTREGPASYVDKNGLIKTVGYNTPRFDHDPITGESKGLLIEQSRYNMFAGTANMGSEHNCWIVGGPRGKRGANVKGPDGKLTALNNIYNGTNGDLNIYYSPRNGANEMTTTNNTTYTMSVWAKLSAGASYITGIRLRTYGQNISVNYNLSTGVVVGTHENQGSDFVSSSIVEYPDNWYRCIMTFKSGTDGNQGFQIYLIAGTSESLNSSGANGESVSFWGAQLEAGSNATSFIPTDDTNDNNNGSKTTRGYEYLSMEGSDASDLYNALEGTLVAEWIATDSESNQNLVSFHKDLGSNERIELRATASDTAKVRFEVVTGGSSTVSDSSISHGGIGDNTKAAFGFEKDFYAFSVNGSAVATDTSGNMPSDINSLMIGRAVWGTSWFDGYVKRILYYPKRLPNSQLITITS